MSGFTSSSNAEAVAAGFRTAAKALADLEEVNAEAGRVILARTRPPRETGATDRGLAARPVADGVALASSAPYWTYPHWGTRYVRANPYLLAATRAAADQVADLYLAHARETLHKIG